MEHPAWINDFVRNVSSYFRDFLETDFRKKNVPKRTIGIKDSQGLLTGINLSRYPKFLLALTKAIGEKPDDGQSFEISVSRGQYSSKVSGLTSSLISAHLATISQDQLDGIKTFLDKILLDNYKPKDPEKALIEFKDKAQSQLVSTIVVPLIQRLESTFKKDGSDGFEVVFRIEEELGNRLMDGYEEQLNEAFAKYVTTQDRDDLKEVLDEICDLSNVKIRITDYCSLLGSVDLFDEIHQILLKPKLNENIETYFYIGTIGVRTITCPIFFIQTKIWLEEGRFILRAERNVLVNKRAIEFAAQEYLDEYKVPTGILVKDRIINISDESSILLEIQPMIDAWTTGFALPNPIHIGSASLQKSSGSLVSITNNFYIASNEKADEALLNDYEDLMVLLESGSAEAIAFTDTIFSFMASNPVTVDAEVSREWDESSVVDRLVYESPVPVNEEQIKILKALKRNETKFVTIQGPPGTGKSHTITAIVFDAIINQKSVLVLSDKTEALDVVEDKLIKTINSIRPDDKFQNPILRLGRSGSTYTKILSQNSLEAVKSELKNSISNLPSKEKEINDIKTDLSKNIETFMDITSQIDLKKVAKVHSLEAIIEKVFPESISSLQTKEAEQFLNSIEEIIGALSRLELNRVEKFLTEYYDQPTLSSLIYLASAQEGLSNVYKTDGFSVTSEIFRSFHFSDFQQLRAIIGEYEELKSPVFGYFFRKRQINELNSKLYATLSVNEIADPHKRVDSFKAAYEDLASISNSLNRSNIPEEYHTIFFNQVLRGIPIFPGEATVIKKNHNRILSLLEKNESLKPLYDILPINIGGWLGQNFKSVISALSDYSALWNEISGSFNKIPDFDYVGTLDKIHKHNTTKLAAELDQKVISFTQTSKNVAHTLKAIIRKKQRFPKDEFGALKRAFPVIISGIRDYAEFIPLERGMFDIVVIDEASQVSIAQALPAFIRSNKMVVLGDPKQFSNVKTSTASNEINQGYLTSIYNTLDREILNDSILSERIRKFNIRTSVLDFVVPIANFHIALKKHFRGYPELISFSSKYFYNNGLQAVKIRGVPISEVIRFSLVEEPSEAIKKNINEDEADAIISELRLIHSSGIRRSVGVITPFTEQQRFLLAHIQKQADGVELIEKLDIKVMTFDSCQGEERDIILYSAVASRDKDRLKYIFPSSLDGDDVEENLRQQRLNVGLSRAKERIHFFLSKPIEEFSGAFGTALRHYKSISENLKELPTAEQLDPNSPMEKTLLNWLRETSFYQTQTHNIEVDAQFKIGEYLKQLNPNYRHPSYKVDFLIKFTSSGKSETIILEYDGFKEHFTQSSNINEYNYLSYMKPEDIERQKVLESYGYRFLRINRFNTGKDPVGFLDRSLWSLFS